MQSEIWSIPYGSRTRRGAPQRQPFPWQQGVIKVPDDDGNSRCCQKAQDLLLGCALGVRENGS